MTCKTKSDHRLNFHQNTNTRYSYYQLLVTNSDNDSESIKESKSPQKSIHFFAKNPSKSPIYIFWSNLADKLTITGLFALAKVKS